MSHIEKLTVKEAAETIERILEDKPMTTRTRISVKETAQLMGISEQFIRIGLQEKILPFGTAVKLSTRWTYHISPNLIEKYTGCRVND